MTVTGRAHAEPDAGRASGTSAAAPTLVEPRWGATYPAGLEARLRGRRAASRCRSSDGPSGASRIGNQR